MKRNYNSPEIEIVEALDVVTTSSEVESERIPLGAGGTSLNEIYDV